MNISEADWRVFKEVRAVALDRFCRRILDECRTLCDEPSESAHQRYLSLYKLLQQRDKEIAEAFNDFRRSTAIFALMTMRQYGLVTEAEWKRFSPDTLRWVLGND